jgi:hypothetical protein
MVSRIESSKIEDLSRAPEEIKQLLEVGFASHFLAPILFRILFSLLIYSCASQ